MEQKADSVLMLVDDEVLTLQALSRLFRDQFTCLEFSDPQAALLELKKGCTPQIILADFGLPGQNGMSFLVEARHLAPLSVRCLFSGQMSKVMIEEALNSGVIHRFFHKPWDNQDLRLHMTECLELYKLMEQATTDPLTRALNRRGIFGHLGTELERSKRHERPLSLLMLDLDHFKVINDTCGHASGDEAIRQAAKILKASVRNIDFVGRLGGDEFLVLLPDTELSSAKTIAERIRSKFQMTYIPGFPKNLSVSIGISTLCKDSAKTANELIEGADQALYQAKKLGKNRVETDSTSARDQRS